jgi:hypothetical protein
MNIITKAIFFSYILLSCVVFAHSLTKAELDSIINKGTYAMVESPSESVPGLSEKDEEKRYVELGKRLTSYKLPHVQILGSYEGTTTKYSYFVWMPEGFDKKRFQKIILDLGKEFQQESVILSSAGFVQLAYTGGSNFGMAYTGHGYNDNYSSIKTSDGQEYFIGEYNLNRDLLVKIVDL